MTWTRGCVCLLIAALAAPAAADARVPRSLKVSVPAPGHVSIDIVKRTVTGPARGLPKRLTLRPQKLRALPSSVRILYAQRTIHRKRSTIYELVLVTVSVAKPAANAARVTDGERELNGIAAFLMFMGSPNAAIEYQRAVDRGELAPFQVFDTHQHAANADLFTRVKDSDNLTDTFNGIVDPNRDGRVDPGLDTGHYDDGHAFGWNVKSKADEKKTFRDLLNDNLSDYILQLEDSFKYDIDGDGTVEKPGQAGQQIDTQVGAPVITGGGAP
jgi:hypothetical protein